MTSLVIGIVGPCASGKSTLIANLKLAGYNAKHIAQEHSYVANMWERITNPDYLIYLDVTYPVSMERRKTNLTQAEFDRQVYLLRHAHEHANLYIDTTNLSIQQVYDMARKFLDNVVGQSS